MKRIAIFASGRGSNALKIIDHLAEKENIEISLIVSNKAGAGVLDIAQDRDIPFYVINRAAFYNSNEVIERLTNDKIDLIVLAGFLWLVPQNLIQTFPSKIINIHPALLPKYGGKGMYGMHVHRAVKEAEESESGITIHYVNEKFDEGEHIFQASCTLDKSDTPEDIAKKVLALEHKYYPIIIEELLGE